MSGTISPDAPQALDCPVFYFDFAPVLARSAALRRNPERLALMCENCVKRLAPGGIMLAEDSGFFLVVQSAAGSAADALTHEINIALLELFFGADALAQSLGSICRKASLQEISDRGIALPAAAASAAPVPARLVRPSQLEMIEADPLARLAQGGVPGYDGLSTGFVPLINLRSDIASLYLCGAVRRHEGKNLFGATALAGTAPQDRASLDEAMLEYSLGFARAMPPTKSAVAIIAPVNFETLAWSRGRQLYQKALRAADAVHNPFLLVKIEGVPSGTPAARLAEVVAMVRPFVRHVFLELPAWNPALLRGGLMGVSGFMTPLPPSDDLAVSGRTMAGLVQLATGQQAVACVTGIEGVNQLALARSAGVRFAARRDASLCAAPPEVLAA
jgi:hypothetical protein